ncbi:MAG: hypothetical protein AAB947_00580 [Patescibacteria group bacterium]
MNRPTNKIFFFIAICAVTVSAIPTYLPHLVSAQTGALFGRFDNDLRLEMSPLHPRPGESVRISAHSASIDLPLTSLEWIENGKKIGGGVSVADIEIKAGVLGTETTVTVIMFENGIERVRKSVRINPTELDLLWESDSYVPPFFRGRALPSAGTNLYLQAIPRFKRTNGSLVPVSDIVFTWRRNDYVLQKISGRGAGRAVLGGPSFLGTDTISVHARSLDGLFETEEIVRIPSVEPRLVLYENHPLAGVMYHNAILSQNLQNYRGEVEMSLVAIPYFAEAQMDDDNSLIYKWKVNGNAITNNPERPNSITINASGSSGLAFVELALSHATNLFLNSFGSWSMTLSSERLVNDPFTNTQ